MNSQSTFLILTDFWLFFQKDVNQITLNHTTLKNLALPIFEVFVQVMLNMNLSLNQTPDILVLCERNLDDSIDPGNFSILGPTLVLPYINDLPDDVICILLIYADDATLYSKCDQVSDEWQQLDLASELESDLRDTVDWGSKWLVDFNAGKTQPV